VAPTQVNIKYPEEKVLDINPHFDYNKPNKMVFQYHEPSQGLEPAHTPDKKLYPGRWMYYDFDLDAVREEVAKDISFARNLSINDFKDREDFYFLLVEHNRR
jgi:hypothetical protein